MMSFSYSGDPGSSIFDESRFIIGDTDADNPIMQDEEILYIINQAGSNVNKLRYMLFTQAATSFAREIKRSLGPQSEDPTKRLEYFTSQAAMYKAKVDNKGVPVSSASGCKIFHVGMHSNPPLSPTRRS